MAQARYERLHEQSSADVNDDCPSESGAESVTSERILNDPPDRHDIWNQPWWLFLLMVLLFLGLVVASIGVHAAICSSKPAIADPVTDTAFTKLLIREQISTMHIGRETNTTMCSIPRLNIDGIGPAWYQASETVSMSNLNFDLGERILLSVSNALQTAIDVGVQSILGSIPSIDAGKTRLVGVAQADMLLAQIGAGSIMVESRQNFLRGRGLSIPMIVGGNLPDISSDYNTDLIGAIDKAKDLVFVLQDACLRARVVNRTRNVCTECFDLGQHALSGVTETEYGVIASNNHFEHHMHSFLVEPGSPVRLRVYNAASGTNFFLNITSENVFVPSHVIAIDGHWIAPADLNILSDPLWVGVGQRIDIIMFIPSRRWTRVLILAVEEGRQLGRQTGISLTTDKSMETSKVAEDPPKIQPTRLYDNWGNELIFRKPVTGSRFDQEYEFKLTDTTTQAALQSADVNAVLYLNNDNSINGREGNNVSNASFIHVTLGNQVTITFVNSVTEALPMRVYGHSFTIINLSGRAIDSGIVRDTILIPSRQNATITFRAINPGLFPIACMNEFRSARGMVAYLEYVI